jgi:anti-anti-sigma factor
MRTLANVRLGSVGPDVVTATIVGEIDMGNVPELTDSLLSAMPSEAGALILELTDVAYLDSSGIRMLADVARRLGWRSQELVIVAPPGCRARTVLALTGVDRSLRLTDSIEVARALVTDDG